MSLDRKEMSFSRRRESQILHVSSSEAVTKKAALWATAMRLMARLCSARCATRMPRGCHAVLDARSASTGRPSRIRCSGPNLHLSASCCTAI